MRITCDTSCNMGYIYLMPPRQENLEHDTGNKIHLYLELSQFNGSVSDGTDLVPRINKIPRALQAYNEALKLKKIKEEYGNDKDSNGYMIGVELNLSKQEFLRRITQDAFRIFQLHWKGEDSLLVTLDTVENVFHPKNTLFAMNSSRDVYLIVQIKELSHIALIKALISARPDLYPLDYLKAPSYFLWE